MVTHDAAHASSGGPTWLSTAPEHSLAAVALLFLPVALVGVIAVLQLLAPRCHAVRRIVDNVHRAHTSTHLATLLMLATAVIHLVLVPAHAGDPLRAALFALDGAAFMAVSLLAYSGRPWRAKAALLTVATLGAYGVYLLQGLEAIDVVGIVTKLVEAGALMALAISAFSSPIAASGDPGRTAGRKQYRSPVGGHHSNN